MVTGARGFFGRYLVDTLLALNAGPLADAPIQILALDSNMVESGPPTDWLNRPNLTTYNHDVRHDLGNPMLGGPPLTHVWHLAGIASPYWYQRLPEETIAVAVDGTRNMLGLAREHKARFLFTSSSEVYQTAEVVPTPETYVGAVPSLTGRSCYDVSKLMAETLCYVEATKHGTHATVVRIFNSFGPGMGEHDRRILPRIASAVVARRELRVFVDARQPLPRRTYTPVANTLLGFLLAAVKGESVGRSDRQNVNSATGVYNVGLDSPELTVPELINRIAQSVRLDRIAYVLVPPPENYLTEPLRRCPDIKRLKTLGFLPCMDLDQGLELFFSWALSTYTGLE